MFNRIAFNGIAFNKLLFEYQVKLNTNIIFLNNIANRQKSLHVLVMKN